MMATSLYRQTQYTVGQDLNTLKENKNKASWTLDTQDTLVALVA